MELDWTILRSEEQTMYRLRFQFPGTMRLGDRGDGVTAAVLR